MRVSRYSTDTDRGAGWELCRGDSIKMRVSRFPVPLICKMSEGTDFLASVKEGLFWNMRVAQKKPEELED
jgi:hypothetical protein